MSTRFESMALRRLNSPATICQTPKSMKKAKHPNQISSTSLPRTASTGPSPHFSMIELKQRLLTSLSKLGDRDTYHIAVDDLENLIAHLSREEVPMVVNCLCEASADPKSAVKKESIRLLSVLCRQQGDTVSSQLSKIIGHIVKRLKDSDSAVRDSCTEAIGVLSSLYLRGEGENGGNQAAVSWFLKPLLDSMNEQNKGVQAGSAQCLVKLIDCAAEPPIVSFQKLCPKICKFLNSPNFLAKAALLLVVGSLSQVGAIASPVLEPLMKSIHNCLGSSDWATRKAAAETLSALAIHSSKLVIDSSASTLEALEGSRFDKVKPVRDSVVEALQAWKIISEAAMELLRDPKDTTRVAGTSEAPGLSRKELNVDSGEAREGPLCTESTPTSPLTSAAKIKSIGISEKAVGILKKKAPGLTYKELNPEFFQKLETRRSDELPVEVVVPRKYLGSSTINCEKDPKSDCTGMSDHEETSEQVDDHCCGEREYRDKKKLDIVYMKCKDLVQFGQECAKGRVVTEALDAREFDGVDVDIEESSEDLAALPQSGSQLNESFKNSKGNWVAIQKQLLQLERQQAHLLNLLQDFMGGSHESMLTLENRMRGLERVVDDMVKDMSINPSRSATSFVERNFRKFNGFHNYAANSLVEDDELVLSRDTFSRVNSLISNNMTWHDNPSAHSTKSTRGRSRRVWEASKDGTVLEKIRGIRDGQPAQREVPESDIETLGDEENLPEENALWTSWTNAMEALRFGEFDSAYSEVLSTGSDYLLVKLMSTSGPVIDHLSNETRSEILQALGNFLQDQNLLKICLPWTQQLVDMIMEDGADIIYIPMELKLEILINLGEADADDLEGELISQLSCQLASAWGVDLQQLQKY